MNHVPPAARSGNPAAADRQGIPAADHRGKPRRRGEQLLAAIFDAALAELDESGYAPLSMASIASRAQVSKASLYRRWPGKAELIIDAVKSSLLDPGEPHQTGTLRGDILNHYRLLVVGLSGPAGKALKGMLSDTLRDPAMAEQFSNRARGRNLAIMRLLAERAADRGELASAAISELRLEAGHNLIRHEWLMKSGIGDEFLVELVDEVVLPLLHAP
ncbi:TetR family transcriptional regulator [Arthrobacter stackebrandtii]|nr:TetR family transcriptional regulator [Arthrobacter stackebrandtii]